MPGFHHSVAVLSLVDNQSAFWSLHPYVYGKTFQAFPFSPATATVATVRNNGNGMVETRHKTSVRMNRPARLLMAKHACSLLSPVRQKMVLAMAETVSTPDSDSAALYMYM